MLVPPGVLAPPLAEDRYEVSRENVSIVKQECIPVGCVQPACYRGAGNHPDRDPL